LSSQLPKLHTHGSDARTTTPNSGRLRILRSESHQPPTARLLSFSLADYPKRIRLYPHRPGGTIVPPASQQEQEASTTQISFLGTNDEHLCRITGTETPSQGAHSSQPISLLRFIFQAAWHLLRTKIACRKTLVYKTSNLGFLRPRVTACIPCHVTRAFHTCYLQVVALVAS
jgi:hypothetical protein